MLNIMLPIFGLVIIIFLAAGIYHFYLIELRYRDKFRAVNFRDAALHSVVFYSTGLHKEPHQEISFRFYAPKAKLLASADIRLNNMGYFSKYDYNYEQQDPEFRIVVIGGEQSASSVVNQSWPDFLQEELNRRDHSKTWKVFNIGWPDAGPEHYLEYWNQYGKTFKPDLVMINFPESDFFRTLKGVPQTFRGHKLDSVKLFYRLGPSDDDTAWTSVRCIEGTTPKTLRNPNAVPSRPYGMFTSRVFMSDTNRVSRLQNALADDMIQGAMPPFSAFVLNRLLRRKIDEAIPSFNRFLFKRFWSRKKRPRASELRNFDQNASASFDPEWLVQFGLKSFGALIDAIPNLLLIHNFNYEEYSQKTTFNTTQKMMQSDSRINIIDMRKRVPVNISDEELKSWYIFPQMAEKWSLKGHQAYARMVADLVMERCK